MTTPFFLMFVGISGCGKTSLSKQLAKQTRASYLASDDIRQELWGDENDQRDPGKVFDLMNKRTFDEIRKGHSVIYDATNLSAKRRKHMCQQVRHINQNVYEICVVIATAPYVCIDRRTHGTRKVPAGTIRRQLTQFEVPSYAEGWDNIMVCSGVTSKADIQTTKNEELATLNLAENMNHDSSHHTAGETVQDHLVRVTSTMAQVASILDSTLIEQFNKSCFAIGGNTVDQIMTDLGAVHDIGKVYTKVVGKDGEAHYYGHDHVSAYLYLSLSFANMPAPTASNKDVILAAIKDRDSHTFSQNEAIRKLAFIIGNHMRIFSFPTYHAYADWLDENVAAYEGELTTFMLKALNAADRLNSI